MRERLMKTALRGALSLFDGGFWIIVLLMFDKLMGGHRINVWGIIFFGIFAAVVCFSLLTLARRIFVVRN